MRKILLATLVALCGCGVWGYDKTGTFRPMSWFFDEYVTQDLWEAISCRT